MGPFPPQPTSQTGLCHMPPPPSHSHPRGSESPEQGSQPTEGMGPCLEFQRAVLVLTGEVQLVAVLSGARKWRLPVSQQGAPVGGGEDVSAVGPPDSPLCRGRLWIPVFRQTEQKSPLKWYLTEGSGDSSFSLEPPAILKPTRAPGELSRSTETKMLILGPGGVKNLQVIPGPPSLEDSHRELSRMFQWAW